MPKRSRQIVEKFTLRLTESELKQLNLVAGILGESMYTKTIIKALYDLPYMANEIERQNKFINQLQDLNNDYKTQILEAFEGEERKQANTYLFERTGREEPEDVQTISE